jgi:hypothetical protein
VAFLTVGQQALGRSPWNSLRGAAAALLLGIGLSVNNSRAVCEGLRGPAGPWERTPKTGGGRPAPAARGQFAVIEAALAVGFASAGVYAVAAAQYRTLPFLLLMAAGFASVAWSSRPPREA